MLDFEELTWQHKASYEEFYRKSPVHYAEYSFSNLWTWKDAYPLKLAFDRKNNLCWVKFKAEHLASDGICGPVGDWNDANIDWQDTLSHLDLESNPVIYDVPEQVKEILSSHEIFAAKLQFYDEPGQDEYVYSVQELISLKGKNFAHKRNRLRAFLTGYEWDYYEIKPENFQDIMDFQERWRLNRDLSLESEEIESLQDENRAIKLTLEHWNDFKFLGAMLKIDDSIIAYTIAEDLDGESLDVKFEKAFAEYSGSYQAMNQLFLKNHGFAYKFANREEDLDEPGLREAKLSYNPVKMLRKFTLRFSD